MAAAEVAPAEELERRVAALAVLALRHGADPAAVYAIAGPRAAAAAARDAAAAAADQGSGGGGDAWIAETRAQIVALRHVYGCEDVRCVVPGCSAGARAAIAHVRSCGRGDCPEPGCARASELLSHFARCYTSPAHRRCVVCEPLCADDPNAGPRRRDGSEATLWGRIVDADDGSGRGARPARPGADAAASAAAQPPPLTRIGRGATAALCSTCSRANTIFSPKADGSYLKTCDDCRSRARGYYRTKVKKTKTKEDSDDGDDAGDAGAYDDAGAGAGAYDDAYRGTAI